MLSAASLVPVVVTPPAGPALSAADLKTHLRIQNSREDQLLGTYCAVAQSYCETLTGRALTPRTVKANLSAFPADGILELPLPPLVSVDSISYRDTAGVVQTLSASAYHVVAAAATVGRIELADGQSWPATASRPDAVTVQWQCGYTPATLPDDFLHALRLFAGHWYYAREASAGEKGRVAPTAIAVDVLLASYRVSGWL